MGNFREKNREGVKEIQGNSRETLDLGTEMREQADQIHATLESIDLQDSEDIAAIRDSAGAYQSSFDNAFSEQVESAGKEIEQQSEQIRSAAGDELGNVRSGIHKLEQAGGMSEIGKEAADSGAAKLETGAQEYEQILSDAENISQETQQQIDSLKSSLGSIFG